MNFQNSNFTANVGDFNVVDTTSGSITCTLPDTSGWGDDNQVHILLFPAGALTSLTIVPAGGTGQKINNANSLVLNAASNPKYVTLVMGGGNWYTF